MIKTHVFFSMLFRCQRSVGLQRIGRGALQIGGVRPSQGTFRTRLEVVQTFVENVDVDVGGDVLQSG